MRVPTSIRYVLSMALGAGLAFHLFVGMQTLISSSDLRLSERQRMRPLDFVRVKRNAQAPEQKRELPSKTPPKAPPKTAATALPGLGAVQTQAIAFDRPDIAPNLDLKGGLNPGAAPSDSQAVPLVRVEPIYPAQAAQRGIEGFVLLQFDINETGAVTNARVVDAKPPGLFDRAAVAAVRQWKYKPKIVGGKALQVKGVRVSLKFELKD